MTNEIGKAAPTPYWKDFTDTQIDELFAELEAAVTKGWQGSEVQVLSQKVIRHLPLWAFRMPFPARFYRARPWNRDDRPLQKSEVSLRPSAGEGGHHRAGFPGIPLFYAANNLDAALLEVRAGVSQKYIVSEWEVTTPLLVLPLGFDQAVYLDWGHDSAPTFFDPEKEKKEIPADARRILNRMSREFVREFQSDDEHAYKLSAALARAVGLCGNSELIVERGMTGKGAPMEGILFPSVVRRGHAQNVAIRRSSVERCLRLLCCSLYQVTEARADEIEKRELDFGVFDAGADRIQWKGRPGQWLIEDAAQLQLVEKDKWKISPPDGRPLYRG